MTAINSYKCIMLCLEYDMWRMKNAVWMNQFLIDELVLFLSAIACAMDNTLVGIMLYSTRQDGLL